MNDYDRIEAAIKYLKNNFQSQPELDEVAKAVHMSPFHFQRIFKEWAGVSPKKFLQYISLNHAKKLLAEKVTLLDAAYDTGLSSAGRLYDLFVNIEGMTPGEYKNAGENLAIEYCFANTLFGKIIIAATQKGICNVSFISSEESGFIELKAKWTNAHFIQKQNEFHQQIINFFNHDWNDLSKIKLHLKGSAFQLKVWESLLKVPQGSLTTYASVAASINNGKAIRAVGTAIGQNPVAFIIPCHRVIRSSGIIGDYHWGELRKTAIIGWECSKVYGEAI
jgi:AraC family transcriptional regulator of adaptative response/methylated-DNA-[protein]-cysteine methyltransferase